MINTFIWSTIKKQDIDKRTNPKMSHTTIIQDSKKGGCRFLHLQSEINAFAARWIQRLLDPSKASWKGFVWHKLEKATAETNFAYLQKEWLFTSTILDKDI